MTGALDPTRAPVPDPWSLLFSQVGADAPHDAYRELRDRCPVARTRFAGAPAVFLTRYEDVLWALRHPEVFSSAGDALELGADQPLIPLQLDPPAHTRYRRLLNPDFVLRKTAELEHDIRVLAQGLVDGFAGRGSCDFHLEFATPLPSTVFLRLMGLPQSDLDDFLRWRDDTVRPDVPAGDLAAAAQVRERAANAISGYFEEAIESRRREPDDGLLSQLVHATIDGEALSRRRGRASR
ncbi:MAG: hypothetical protein WD598_07005 [Acidimicrobiia bacterium]